MNDRFFLDTNVVAYALTDQDPAKQAIAQELFRRAGGGEGVISYQVIQELLHVAQRKFRPPLSVAQRQRLLEVGLLPLCGVHSSPGLFRDALALQERFNFSWYDALIVAAARDAGCRTLYSEDLQHGLKVDGLTVKNPFLGA